MRRTTRPATPTRFSSMTMAIRPTTHELNLPPDEGDDVDSRPNRSAAAVASTTQTPKPIEISGHVWIDNDLDVVREPGEQTLPALRSRCGSRAKTAAMSTPTCERQPTQTVDTFFPSHSV